MWLSTSLNSTLGAYQEAAKDTQQGLDISNAVEDIAVSQTPDDAMVEKQVTGEVASLKDARVQGAL